MSLKNKDALFWKNILRELRMSPWYWGAISANQAQQLLKNKKSGTFLVRDSRSDNCIFSVSYIIEDKVFHSRLPRFNGKFCLGGPNALIRSHSLVNLIKQTINYSIDEKRSLRILMHNLSMEPTALNIELKYPLHRTSFMPSLKYFCRLIIRNVLAETGNSVKSLPLPKKLKKYIASATYLFVS